MILTAEGRSNGASPWYRNTFGKLYIAPDSIQWPAQTFANAVCRMQKRQGYTLSVSEKRAIDKWLEKPAAGVQSNSTTMVSLADHLLQLKGNNNHEKRKADDMDDGLNTKSGAFVVNGQLHSDYYQVNYVPYCI